MDMKTMAQPYAVVAGRMTDQTDPALKSLRDEISKLEQMAEFLGAPVVAHLLGMAALEIEDTLSEPSPN